MESTLSNCPRHGDCESQFPLKDYALKFTDSALPRASATCALPSATAHTVSLSAAGTHRPRCRISRVVTIHAARFGLVNDRLRGPGRRDSPAKHGDNRQTPRPLNWGDSLDSPKITRFWNLLFEDAHQDYPVRPNGCGEIVRVLSKIFLAPEITHIAFIWQAKRGPVR